MTEKLQEGCTVQPQTKEELAAIIKQTCEEQGWDCDLNFIDTSKITDMSFLFSDDDEFGYGLSDFNGDISQWNTSNVTNMSHMFDGATTFNQPLNNWNTSNVDDMRSMFADATSFNQSIDNWNTSNVKNMRCMFSFAESFNQPLDNWDVSNVVVIEGMFKEADNFKSKSPDFKNFRGSKEVLLEELGLQPDYKPEIKQNHEEKKAHKKGMSR